LIVFDNDLNALHYVERLHLLVDDVATFRDRCHVLVFDGADRDQHDRITQLARTSSATSTRALAR
jgi:hypothetical protein